MKKLPLVMALSAAFVCTLASAQSSVQVYGKLYPYLVSEEGSSPTAPGTAVSSLAGTLTNTPGVGAIKGMQSGNSRIGFRGTEDLGGGLKAFFQLESVVAVDNGAAGGGTTFWNRDTFVGMKGGFGEVRLGLMDTIFKNYGDPISFMGVSSGTPMSSSNMMRKPGFGTSNNARFHERRPNSIAYESPEFNDISFGAMVSTSETSVTANPALGNAKTYSYGVKYDKNAWYLALAHEIHTNFFGGSSQAPSAMRNNGAADNIKSNDQATQATVEWRISKAHKVALDIIRKEYKEEAIVNNRFKSYDNIAYQIAFESRLSDKWRLGGHYVRSQAGSCTRLNAVCNTDGLEGSKLMFGGGYYLSRRTNFYAAYNQVTNGKSARFGAAPEFGSPAPGEDYKQYIFGISHSF